MFLCGYRDVPDATCERCNTNEVQYREFAKSGGTKNYEKVYRGGLQSKRVCGIFSDATSDELGLFGSAKETEKTASCGSNNRGRAQANASGEWWQAEPDVGRVADGVLARVDRLRCLGNAVVPQQIYPLLQAIADYENKIGG